MTEVDAGQQPEGFLPLPQPHLLWNCTEIKTKQPSIRE